MEIPRGFEICFSCKNGANLISLSAEPPTRKVVEHDGIKFVFQFTLKCNNCGYILHNFIPVPSLKSIINA